MLEMSSHESHLGLGPEGEKEGGSGDHHFGGHLGRGEGIAALKLVQMYEAARLVKICM